MADRPNHFKKPSIPIPEDCYINQKDKRIYVKVATKELTDSETAEAKPGRIVVGRLASLEDKTFYPNRKFGEIYPNLWLKYYGYNPTLPSEVRIGVYAALLGILEQTGLYDVLTKLFDSVYVNAILDYAVFSIVCGSNVSKKFEAYSQENLFLFGEKPYDDQWISDFLSDKLKHDAIEKFKLAWIKQCSLLGITECWISIDGSNCDCDAEDVDYAEYGNSKSESGKPIISYICAVCAEGPHRGMPLAYEVNNGSMPDCKQQHTIATLLGENSMKVKGSIYDRGFCDNDDISELQNLKYDYLLKLRKDLVSYKYMMENHADEIRRHFDFLISTEGNLFGTADQYKIFVRSKDISTIFLFYNSKKGSDQEDKLRAEIAEYAAGIIAILDSINKDIDSLSHSNEGQVEDNNPKEGQCKDGQDGNDQKDESVFPKLPTILEKYQKYLSIVGPGENGYYKLVADGKTVDDACNQLGFWALASSLPLTPKEAFDIYRLRDCSETQFSIAKTQHGNSVMRGHSTANIDGRFLVAFVAGIIRSCIMAACLAVKGFSDVNSIVRELNRIKVRLGTEGNCYHSVRSYSDDQLAILAQFGVRREHIDALAARVTERFINLNDSIVHSLPIIPKKRRGRPPKPKTDDKKPSRKRGRPPKTSDASSKKSSAESTPSESVVTESPSLSTEPSDTSASITSDHESSAAQDLHQSPPSDPKTDGIDQQNNVVPKRKPGRPKGRLNNKTLERLAREKAEQEAATLENETAQKEDNSNLEQLPKKRGPGRPKGSKNKPKSDVAATKRPRGRPRKNP